jgi:hypothetical protein
MVDTATLETIGEGALDVGLFVVGLAFPPALPFIAIAKEAIPALIAARPFIVKAAQDGTSAFSAASATSPGLGDKIKALAGFLPFNATAGIPHLDMVTIVGAGFAVPGWTVEETQRWMDRATRGNDPSQENSNVGSG